jgi:hypothetical protein
MLDEKQLATILVKIKLKKGSSLWKYVRGYTKNRDLLKRRVLDYMHKHIRFARYVVKAGMSVDKIVTILQNGR